MIAVKHCHSKGLSLIRDRLRYGRWIPWPTTTRNVKRGLDITWTLGPLKNKGLGALEHWSLGAFEGPEGVAAEPWPGGSSIIAFAALASAMGGRGMEPVQSS